MRMPTNQQLDQCYMAVANAHAMLSKAVRKKVGACLVTKTGVIIPGYNGTPSGVSNECETTKWEVSSNDNGVIKTTGTLVTKAEVIHAELNTILKAAKEGVRIVESTLYVSLSPCISCAAMLLQVGIMEVVYAEAYRDTSGVEYLQQNGVRIRKLDHF